MVPGLEKQVGEEGELDPSPSLEGESCRRWSPFLQGLLAG